MKKRGKQGPEDVNEIAFRVIEEATSEEPSRDTDAPVRGQNGGKAGGKSRASKLSPEQRSEIARAAAAARWKTG